MSEEEGFLEAFVSEARVLDLGRKGEDDCAGGDAGVEELAFEKAGCEGERLADASEAAEWDLDDIGTINPCRF